MRIYTLRSQNSYRVLPTALFFATLVASVCVSFFFITAPAVITPTAGVALAGLILLGVRYWPFVFIAIYTTYLFIGAPFLFVLCFAIGYTIQAVFGSTLLERLDFDPKLARLQDALVLIIAAFATGVIAPTFGFIGLWFVEAFSTGQVAPQAFAWSHWWIGMILSIVILTPLITRWLRPMRRYSVTEVVEAVFALSVMAGVAVLVTWLEIRTVANISLVYLLLIPLGWIALRLGPRVMTLALFLLTITTLSGGLIVRGASGLVLFQTEVFLVIVALIFLILVALEEERKAAGTRLRQNVGELQHALQRLHDQDQMKNNFLAVLAHELRNPLAAIVSNVELLKLNKQTDEQGAASLDVIETRLTSVGRLLDDLLDVSRISENKITLKKTNIDMRDIATRAAENIEHSIHNKQQSFAMDLPNEPLMMKADETRMEQILTNLLHNASKFTPRGGSIELVVTRRDHSVVIRVQDSGVGIEPDHLPHVFNVFYQAKGRTEEARSGLGIGLALTRDFVRMHGGSIVARSEGRNSGSEFVVTLPLVHSKLPEVEREQLVVEKKDDSPLTWEKQVLVVDDNHTAAESIAKLLRMSGYTVTCAYNGAETIEKTAQAFKPDAILLDIGLPDMTGYDVACALREEHGYAGAIIALSGYGQEEDKQRAYAAGCTHHLTKPVRLSELLDVLK
ncbi:MAG: ATP-binding protein [Candidatus Paceibacterota bacterium]